MSPCPALLCKTSPRSILATRNKSCHISKLQNEHGWHPPCYLLPERQSAGTFYVPATKRKGRASESSAQEESYIVEAMREHYDRIFVLMGRVGDAITERQDAELTIEDFAKSAEKQLMEEEEFLLSHHKPEFRFHLAQHRFFARQVILLKSACRTGQLALARNIVEFLKMWLNYHLVKECRKYAAALPEMRW